jgi:hypothetical protein
MVRHAARQGAYDKAKEIRQSLPSKRRVVTLYIYSIYDSYRLMEFHGF